jgi:hypothetical protein
VRTPLPIPELSPAQVAKFWSFVKRAGQNECWLWTGYCTRHQRGGGFYGLWQITVNGKTRHLRPSRIVHTLCIGPIPEGFTVDHVRANGCTNSLCCNPAHLEAVTHEENLRRRNDFRTGLCKRGHPIPLRTQGVKCQACIPIYMREYRARKAEQAS